MTEHIFITMFDSLGFECIIDITRYEQECLMAQLTGKPVDSPVSLRHLVIRAQANHHRYPEIWKFTSEFEQDELVKLAQKSPQLLANTIRELGVNIFKTAKPAQVIS